MFRKTLIAIGIGLGSVALGDIVTPELRSLGFEVNPAQEELIRTTLPEIDRTERLILRRLTLDAISKLEDGDREARVCIRRCSGTGSERVCWDVCVDNDG